MYFSFGFLFPMVQNSEGMEEPRAKSPAPAATSPPGRLPSASESCFLAYGALKRS